VRLSVLALGLALLLSASSAAALPAVKTIRIQVVDEARRPVPGATVTLVELARRNIENRVVGKTDAAGRLVVRLADEQETGRGPHKGWGVYRLVVAKPGYAWHFSDLICHGVSPHSLDRRGAWGVGGTIDLRSRASLDLTFGLSRGATLTGLVRDTTGAPIAGARVWVQADLEAKSHTGASGAFPFADLPDATGGFRVAPLGDFVWWVDAIKETFYRTQTAADLRGIPVRVTGGRDQQVEIVLAATPANRYFGVVRDALSKAPIPGVTVTLSYTITTSGHFTQVNAVTGPDGRYEYAFEYPHVYVVAAQASGYRPTWTGDRYHYPPGEYDLELDPLPESAPRYHGVVRDRLSTAPIADAGVAVCYRAGADRDTRYLCLDVRTNGNGRWEAVVEYPLVAVVIAEAGAADEWMRQAKPDFLPPGEYDFALERRVERPAPPSPSR
jgi:hypothetical protein